MSPTASTTSTSTVYSKIYSDLTRKKLQHSKKERRKKTHKAASFDFNAILIILFVIFKITSQMPWMKFFPVLMKKTWKHQRGIWRGMRRNIRRGWRRRSAFKMAQLCRDGNRNDYLFLCLFVHCYSLNISSFKKVPTGTFFLYI